MAIPTLKRLCQLQLVEHLVKDRHGCVSLENKCSYILSQLDQGAWGVESLAILNRASKFYKSILTPRVILALLPNNTQSLVLKECPLLTADCVNTAIERCSLLEHLNLTENTNLNFSKVDLFCTVLFTRNQSITAVIFEDCSQINDIHIQTLLLNAPNLQCLNVARCNITDNAFLLNEHKQLAREACFQIDGLTLKFDSKLSTVDVSRCENFSSTGVRYLCSLCGPSLQNVNLSWTKVDCTAFLYLSGMGLPHAVQFFLSTNVVNSALLEALVYTLHEFDAICEDILLKWTEGDQTQPTVREAETTRENTCKVTGETRAGFEMRTSPSQSDVVHIDDIEPEFSVTSASSTNENVNCLDKSFSLSPCDFRYSSSPDSITIEDTTCPTSKEEDFTEHKKYQAPSKTNKDENSPSSFCEEPFSDESCDGSRLPQPYSNTVETASFQQNIDDGMVVSLCVRVDEKQNCKPIGIENEESSENFDDKENVTMGAEINNRCLEQDGSEDKLCKSIDGVDYKNRCVVAIEDFHALKTETDGNSDLEEKVLLSKCSSGDENTSDILNSDQNTRIGFPSKRDKDISYSKNTLKMKMDFEPNISSLQISGNVFREENVGMLCLQTFLKSNKNLQSLSLYGGMTGNFVTDIIIDLIGHYSHKLTYLSIEGCDQVANIGASAIAKNCQQITTLDLTGVPFLGDIGFIPLLRSLPLTSLQMAETQISGLSLNVMAQMANIDQLRDLDLSWCEEIAGDSSLNKLLELCPSLDRLMLRETPLTARTLSIIAENCHNITELSIASNMNDVLDDSVILLAENLPLLEVIDLSWNSDLTDKSIHSLFKHCHRLGTAQLEGLKRITSSALVPIIAVPDELKDFLALTVSDMENSGDMTVNTEILPCLPHRSTTYCTELSYVNLKFSDFVEDARLEELVTVTQGGIKVIDYYGEEVEQSTAALQNVLKRCRESTRVR